MHTTSRHDLAEVRERLIELSELVLTAIRAATDAFNRADAAQADTAVATSERVTALVDEIDELAMDMPASRVLDPREVQLLLCYERLSVRLVRMGDFTRHIAHAAQRHLPERVAPDELHASFVQMSAQAVEAAELVTRLVRTQDLELAHELMEDDQWQDVLQRAAFAAVKSPTWPGGTTRAVDVILTARYLERFGDLAVLIARRIAALRAHNVSDAATTEGAA